MDNIQWLERLQRRLDRFSNTKLNGDTGTLTLIELHSVYCYLSRLASN